MKKHTALYIGLFLFIAAIPFGMAHAEDTRLSDGLTEYFSDERIRDSQRRDEILEDGRVIRAEEFKIESPTTEIADIGNGEKMMRIFLGPRPVYTDEQSGELRLRKPGWNWFYENIDSRIQTSEREQGIGAGYEYSVPLQDGESITVRAGNVEIVQQGRTMGTEVPSRGNLIQFKKDHKVISSVKEVYADIDVRFTDNQYKRQREIIIKQKPEGISDTDTLIFWEEYDLPKGADVFVGDKFIDSGKRYVGDEQLRILLSDQQEYRISGAVVFDSSSDDFMDIEIEKRSLPTLVDIDYDSQKLKFGLEMSGEYLSSRERVYPVIIDPYSYYYPCKENYSGTYYMACNEIDFYLRVYNGNSQSPAVDNTAEQLFTGRWKSGSSNYTRHIVVSAAADFQSLPGDLIESQLKMYYDNLGNGTAASVYMKAKRITKAWPPYNIPSLSYGYFRNDLISENSGVTIVASDTDKTIDFDITNSVQSWMNGSVNWGLLVEPSASWSSGSTPPSSWEDRFLVFHSQRYSGQDTSPYIRIKLEDTDVDLTIQSSSISDNDVYTGDSIHMYATVKNEGSGTAGGSQLGYYLSRDTTWDELDYLLGQSSVYTLSSGSTSNESETINLPKKGEDNGTFYGPDTYYILFKADKDKVISESNENNNVAYKPIYIDEISVDPYEPNDTSGQAEYIGSGTSYIWDDSYLESGDEDWFKFQYDNKYYYFKVIGYNSGDIGTYGVNFNRSGSEVTIETFGDDSSLDTKLYLYDASLNQLDWDDDDGPSAYSKIIYDLDPNQPPNTCTLSSPSNGSTGHNTSLTLDWSCSDPDSSIDDYYLQIDNNSDFNSPFYADWLGNSSSYFNATGLSYSTKYYWRVKGEDSEGAQGNFNNAWNFTVKSAPSGGGSSCGSSCSPTDNKDNDEQTESEETIEGLSDYVANLGPFTLKRKLENSNELDESDAVADPVNARTGSFELTQTDLLLQGRGASIDFVREYNSKTEKNGRFGMGWRYSYNQYYFLDPSTNKVIVYKGGTVASIFEQVDGIYKSIGSTDKLYYDAGNEYLILEKLSGVKYYYATKLTDNMGLLQKIADTNGNETTFNYIDLKGVDMLKTVVDSSGRTIILDYGPIDGDRWDKIEVMTYSTGDPNTETRVEYYYDVLNEVIRLRQVKTIRKYNGQTETEIQKFDYAIFPGSDLYRMSTHEDARGTILYNTYDTEGRVLEQQEYNPTTNTTTLAWELEYLGEDPAVTGDAYCTLVKNHNDKDNYFTQKFCYDSDHLKVYERGTDGNEVMITRDATTGMILNIKDSLNRTTAYEYDSNRRKTKETLPDTDSWHTETTYTYGAFNRVQTKITKVWNVGANYAVDTPVLTRTTSYSIDALNGNILSITDPLGKVEYFSYDNNGNVLTHTDKNGDVTTYVYDAGGNYMLSETKTATLHDGTTQTIKKQYEYDEYGNRTKYTTAEGNVFIYEYDNRGNVLKEIDPYLNTKTYTYDIEEHRTDVYDELNRRIQYVYDTDISASLVEQKRYNIAGDHTLSITTNYDNLGRPTHNYDANGNAVETVYDSIGRIQKRIEPYKTTEYTYYDNGNVYQEFEYAHGSDKTNWQRKTEYIYDARDNVVEVKKFTEYYDTSYIATKYYYDGLGRMTMSVDAEQSTTTMYYDLDDKLTKVVDAVGNTTQYIYDNAGNKIAEKLPRCFDDVTKCNSAGYSNQYVYDEAGRQIKEINATDKYTLYTYNKDGNVAKIIDRQNSNGTQNTHVATFGYDKLGRKISETDAYSKSITYTYDKVGNMTSKTDKMNRTWNYVYDDFDRLVQEKDPDDNVTTYTYDDNGNKIKEERNKDQGNVYTAFEYDDVNRLVKEIDVNDNFREFSYDIFGNKIQEKDKLGRVTNFVYDKLGRLTTETNPQNTVTTYTYDDNGNRLSESIAGKVTSFSYDKLNRIVSITHPGDKSESFSYDGQGNVLTKTDGEEVVTNYTYDKLNRATQKATPDMTVSYTYDQWGNRLTMADSAHTTTYTYDLLSRVLTEIKTFAGLADKSYVVSKTYQDDGQLKTLTDADGRVFSYNYDTRGLLHTVSYDGNDLATYSYNEMNQPTGLTYANGVETAYTYDELARLDTLNITHASTTLFSHDYDYDNENNRTKLTETSGDNSQVVNYAYDNLDQIATVNYSTVTGTENIAFSYDKWGNRKTLTTPVGETTYLYDANSNELTGMYVNGYLNNIFTYDENGSVVKELRSRLGSGLNQVDYTWDDQNRLSELVYHHNARPAFLPTLDDNVLTFGYDDQHNRIRKSVNGQETYYVNDGLRVLNELDNLGDAQKSMVYGLETIAEIDDSGVITYVHTDVLGSTILLTAEDASVVAEYEYDVFGSLVGMNENADANTDYLFTGQEFDPESDLYYYNARYYNPHIGRFISRDILMGRDGDVVSKNRYVYVKNNPLKYVDPTGWEEMTFDEYDEFNDLTSDFVSRLKNTGEEMEDYWNAADWISTPWYGDLIEETVDAMSIIDLNLDPADMSVKLFLLYKFDALSYQEVSFLSEDIIDELQERPMKFKYFYNKINYYAPWDYKNNIHAKYSKNGLYMYSNSKDGIDYFRHYQHDDPGNVSFGYTGAAGGFSGDALKMLAGLAHENTRRNSGYSKNIDSFSKNYWDDPRDQRAIQAGIDLWNKYGLDIDQKKLASYMRPSSDGIKYKKLYCSY